MKHGVCIWVLTVGTMDLWRYFGKCTAINNLVWPRYKSLPLGTVRGHCTLQRNSLTVERSSKTFCRRISRNLTNKTFQVRGASHLPFVGPGGVKKKLNSFYFKVNTILIFTVLTQPQRGHNRHVRALLTVRKKVNFVFRPQSPLHLDT